MRRRITFKLKLHIIVFVIMLVSGVIIIEALSGFHKKSFSEKLYEEIHFKIEQLNTYLSFNNQLHKIKGKKPEFDDEVYMNFKSYIKKVPIPANGTIMVLNKKGDLLVHPSDEGKNISQDFHIHKLLSSNLLENDFFFNDPLDLRKKLVFYDFNESLELYLCLIIDWDDALLPVKRLKQSFQIAYLLLICLVLLSLNFINKKLFKSLDEILSTTKMFAQANYTNLIKSIPSYEIDLISKEYNNLKEYLHCNLQFAEDICNEILDSEFHPLSNNDSLGHSLLKIRDNMKTAKDEHERRKIEDEKQNWLNKGLANFSDLLRLHNDDLKKHSDIIIQNLVSYIGANQGAIFILNKENENEKQDVLELISAFAYDTQKHIKKTIPLGEGLIGTCAIEKRTIFLKEVPEDYIEITSGLGDANPRCILIVPIKIEETVLGVVEIASFKIFEKHEIDFVERIMESVASTLSSAKINAQTAHLLQRFEQQNEQMKAQEEEMRQNMEEMEAVQQGSELIKKQLEAEINILLNQFLVCEYHADGKAMSIQENFASFLNYELSEVTNGSIEEHIKIGFLKYNYDPIQLIEDVCEGDNDVVLINTYNVNGTEKQLEERFIPVKTENDKIIKIMRIARDISHLKSKEDEINELILSQRILHEELNTAKETITTLENTLKNKE